MKEKKKKKKKEIEAELVTEATEEKVEISNVENNEEIVIVASMTEEEALVEVEADAVAVETLELESEDQLEVESSSDSEPTTIVAKEGLVYDREEIVQAIEALVFASPKPISLQRIKRILTSLNFDTENLKEIIEEMQAATENKGVQLCKVAQSYQYRTHRKQADVVQKIVEEKPARLSKSALEVLAIVAYKQPVTRADLDSVRGIDSGHLLRGLLEKNLIKMDGHAELPGRPMLYSTSPYFLEIFSLNSLDDLPSLEEFSRELQGGADADAIVLAADPELDPLSPLAANPDRGDFDVNDPAEERFETPLLDSDVPVPSAEA